MLGVDHKTVISVRESLERTGEIPQLEKTVGKEVGSVVVLSRWKVCCQELATMQLLLVTRSLNPQQ